jgi:hypothetical protein
MNKKAETFRVSAVGKNNLRSPKRPDLFLTFGHMVPEACSQSYFYRYYNIPQIPVNSLEEGVFETLKRVNEKHRF